MFSKLIRALPLLAFAGLLAGCGMGSKSTPSSASTQNSTSMTTAPAAGTVVVSVNGQPITTAQVNAYIQLRTRGASVQLTPVQKRQITEELVQITLAEQAAKQENLQNQPSVQAQLSLNNNLYLANEAVRHYTQTHEPTDAMLQQQYQVMAKAQSGEQYKARHILVKTKAEAQKIIDQLNHGADFATLAKKDSTDTGTAKQGGDLGWFQANQMVPAFSAAVAKLKPGEYTKTPVQTQFGWHVIELEKERTATPPSFTAMRPMLVQRAQGDMTQNYLKQLESSATIKWSAPNPASAAMSMTASTPAKPAATATPSANSATSPATGG